MVNYTPISLCYRSHSDLLNRKYC